MSGVVGVTGASGFIGRALVSLLASRDIPVRALYRSVQPERVVDSLVEQTVIGSLERVTDWRLHLSGLETLVHCAGPSSLPRGVSAERAKRVEVGAVSALEALSTMAAAAGVRRLVFLSSVKVHGEFTVPPHRFDEGSPFAPMDVYARLKAESELRLRAIAKATGLEVVILRMPIVYGPGVKGNLRKLMTWVRRGYPLPLAGLENCRSMCGLTNLCDAIRACLTDPRAENETFFVSDGRDLSTEQLCLAIGRALDRPARLWKMPPKLLQAVGSTVGQRAAVSRLTESLQVDSTRIRALLHWTPPVSLETEIQAMVSV